MSVSKFFELAERLVSAWERRVENVTKLLEAQARRDGLGRFMDKEAQCEKCEGGGKDQGPDPERDNVVEGNFKSETLPEGEVTQDNKDSAKAEMSAEGDVFQEKIEDLVMSMPRKDLKENLRKYPDVKFSDKARTETLQKLYLEILRRREEKTLGTKVKRKAGADSQMVEVPAEIIALEGEAMAFKEPEDYEQEDIRAALVAYEKLFADLKKAGEAGRAIATRYGGPKLNDIPKEKYFAMMNTIEVARGCIPAEDLAGEVVESGNAEVIESDREKDISAEDLKTFLVDARTRLNSKEGVTFVASLIKKYDPGKADGSVLLSRVKPESYADVITEMNSYLKEQGLETREI